MDWSIVQTMFYNLSTGDPMSFEIYSLFLTNHTFQYTDQEKAALTHVPKMSITF